MPSARAVLFRVFYSTSFTIVFLILIAFICVSPADALYQSYRRRRLLDIFLIAGVYVVTALVSLLIYASRLYTTRSVLRDIPKTYIPVDKDDLPGKRTWRLISETIRRSAVIAQQTRPRAQRTELEVEGAKERIEKLLRPETRKNGEDKITAIEPHWGVISHPGWSSPANEEMPDLQYETVVAELTDLVEARAVSLAPIDPLATPAEDGHPVPDTRVIEALTRPDNMGMRQYVSRLIEMEALEGNELTTAFLTLYERARFAIEPLSEVEFNSLMRLFAEVLRNMKQVNLDVIDLDIMEGEIDQDDGKSMSMKSVTSSTFSSASSIGGSVQRHAFTSHRRGSLGAIRVRSRKTG